MDVLLYGIKNAIKAQDHALVVSLTDRIRFLGLHLFSDDLDTFYLDPSESLEEQLNSVDIVWKSVKEKWDIP